MTRTSAVVAVALLVTLAGCVGGLGIEGVSDESDENGADSALEVDTGALEIRHLDVGQADATLVVTPDDETILIDSGDWRADGSGVIDALETQDIDRLDHLVATHGHADHIGGHAAIIEHLETEGEGVGAAYDSGVAHTSQTYDNYLDAIETHDVQLFEVQDGDDLPLEDETLAATVLNPPAGDSGDDLHSNSVTLVLEFGDFAYLTTGDAEADAEQRLVDDHGEALAADAIRLATTARQPPRLSRSSTPSSRKSPSSRAHSSPSTDTHTMRFSRTLMTATLTPTGRQCMAILPSQSSRQATAQT